MNHYTSARFILICLAVAFLAIGSRSWPAIVALVLVVLVLVSVFVGPV